MTNPHNYTLEKYRPGGANRYTCPQCGKRKSFTRYISTQTGQYIHETVGKCNHQTSCGYHLTPKDYYTQHPNTLTHTPTPIPHKPTPITPPPSPSTLPTHYAIQSHSTQSTFYSWLTHQTTNTQLLTDTYHRYLIGATHDHKVIFWQIDHNKQIRTGKIMDYTPDGHRTGNPDWAHSRLARQGLLPPHWQLTQCFFGQHLITYNPQATICLVESEKTAIICHLHHPQHIWLATGGCSLLTPTRLLPLQHRHLTIFPDSGQLHKWQTIINDATTTHPLLMANIHYTFDTTLEQYPPNTDIADIILNNP